MFVFDIYVKIFYQSDASRCLGCTMYPVFAVSMVTGIGASRCLP